MSNPSTDVHACLRGSTAETDLPSHFICLSGCSDVLGGCSVDGKEATRVSQRLKIYHKRSGVPGSHKGSVQHSETKKIQHDKAGAIFEKKKNLHGDIEHLAS